MSDNLWEHYHGQPFEAHKEPNYITQQYIKHLEKERERLEDRVKQLEKVAWLGHKVIYSKWEHTQFEQSYEEAMLNDR